MLTLRENALPKDPKSGLPHAVPSHPAIVEWRAMTVIELYVRFLDTFSREASVPRRVIDFHEMLTKGYSFHSDRIADLIRQQLGLGSEDLTLAQVLESATWKGGREIAKVKRPETCGPPIEIESDGTVF